MFSVCLRTPLQQPFDFLSTPENMCKRKSFVSARHLTFCGVCDRSKLLTGEPAPKKAKMTVPGAGDEAKLDLLDIAEASGEPVHSVKIPRLSARNAPSLAQHAGNKTYLKNPADDAVTLPSATVLCGYGKVAYRQVKDDAAAFDPAQDFDFCLADSDAKLIFDGSMLTLGQLIGNRTEEKSAADAKVCYHTIEDSEPGSATSFVCKQNVQVQLQGLM